MFTSIAAAFPDDSDYQVRACARDECVEWEGARDDPYFLQVVLADVSEPTSVTATLTLTSTVAPGEVVFDESTSVDLARYQPNGPGCKPTVYQGQVQVTAGGDLVPA
jgi:hypothetical protein